MYQAVLLLLSFSCVALLSCSNPIQMLLMNLYQIVSLVIMIQFE